MVFCSHAAISLWFLLFFRFFEPDFLNKDPNSFIVYSRPSFLFEPDVRFSQVVFLFTCDILTLIVCNFWSDFLKNDLLNSFKVHSRSDFIYSWTKFIANIVTVFVFFVQKFCLTILRILLEQFLISEVTFPLIFLHFWMITIVFTSN